ncbi:MAG: hypothetical protein GY953_27925, partial [bacterium]|nr:hypothetical protein [bacterium]
QDTQVPGLSIPLPGAAAEVLDTKGSIWIAQAKLSFPIGKSGVSIPLSVSWANRTELIKANEVRGQFGFTFNLDQILSSK